MLLVYEALSYDALHMAVLCQQAAASCTRDLNAASVRHMIFFFVVAGDYAFVLHTTNPVTNNRETLMPLVYDV